MLENALQHTCQLIHAKRLNALIVAVGVASKGCSIALTSLGRGLGGEAKEKNNIKRMDRLLGNKKLQGEAHRFYQSIALWAISSNPRPILIGDWSTLTADESLHLLRIGIPVGGRTLTIFEQVYPQSQYGSQHAHQCFLDGLKALLPEGCRPVIVTDAGFKNPWFTIVEAMGWFWVGRVRGGVQMCKSEKGALWLTSAQVSQILLGEQTKRAVDCGSFWLAKTNPHQVRAVTYKEDPKGRVALNKRGKKSKSGKSKKYAEGAKEAWLLVTNIPPEAANAIEVVGIYKKRMQIEAGFRDSKCIRFGLGLDISKSWQKERWTILVLIATLTQFLAWIVGKTGYLRERQWDYMANTCKDRKVLSDFFLGVRMLLKEKIIAPPNSDEQLALSQAITLEGDSGLRYLI